VLTKINVDQFVGQDLLRPAAHTVAADHDFVTVGQGHHASQVPIGFSMEIKLQADRRNL
jgi:hypothetical protein